LKSHRRCPQLLLDQEIVTESMAATLSKQIEFLKERTICWQGKVLIGLPADEDAAIFGTFTHL